MLHVTAAQMKAIDRAAIERFGMPAIVLMENAGKAVADEIMKMVKAGTVIIFSGYGNNGGDGFVAAKHLIKNGYKVKAFLVGRPKKFSPESEANLNSMIELGARPETISNAEEMGGTFGAGCSLIVDAIFGTGMKGPLDGFYIKLIDKINAAGLPIVAIDLPSGLDADSGNPTPSAIKASKTVTLGLPKKGFKNPQSGPYVGELVVADIGIPPDAVKSVLKGL
jgi:hydroxyethylthiazole kinase-like uncharacterized protein yjeF